MKDLVQRAVRNDQAAFWELYNLRWRKVFYFAAKILGNEAEAADATQETFLRAYQNIHTLKDPHAFDAWLYRILVNVCNRMLSKMIVRKKHHEIDQYVELIEDEREEFSPAQSFERAEEKRLLMKAIDELNEEQKTAIILYYYQHMTYAAIADATGVSPSGVETRLRRARTSLKKRLLEMGLRETVTSSLLVPPVLAETFDEDSQRVVASQPCGAFEAGIIAAIAKASGTAGGAAGMGSVGGASAGTLGAAAPAGMSMGAVTSAKVIGAFVATVCIGSSVGAVISTAKSTPPLHPGTARIATARAAGISGLKGILTAIPPQETTSTPHAQPVEPSPAEEDLARDDAQRGESKQVTAQAPAPINTIADMIGADNAQWLTTFSSDLPLSRRSDFRRFVSVNGFAGQGVQRFDYAEYRLYVLEKQDKRLRIIERDPRDGSAYGISYVFESIAKEVPELWRLEFEFK